MTQITPAFLDAFGDAWNRHDTDAILAAMTDDCLFQNSGGRGPRGRCYVGKAEVRKGIEELSPHRVVHHFFAHTDGDLSGSPEMLGGRETTAL